MRSPVSILSGSFVVVLFTAAGRSSIVVLAAAGVVWVCPRVVSLFSFFGYVTSPFKDLPQHGYAKKKEPTFLPSTIQTG